MKVYNEASDSDESLPDWITFTEEDDIHVNYIQLRSNNILHKGKWTLRIVATVDNGSNIEDVEAYGYITVHVDETEPPVSVSREPYFSEILQLEHILYFKDTWEYVLP